MTCQRCGKCCKKMGLPPFVSVLFIHDEIAEVAPNMPEELKAEVLATPYTEDANGVPCSWFDPETRLCRHWEYRPKVCRGYSCDCFKKLFPFLSFGE